jgi:hypothetical protein
MYGIFHPLDADQESPEYLAGAKHLTRSGTRHLFFETYHFCCWADEPLRSMDRKII